MVSALIAPPQRFNLLTAALCLFLLDDQALGSWGQVSLGAGAAPGRVRRGLMVGVAVVTIPVSAVAFAGALGMQLPGATALPSRASLNIEIICGRDLRYSAAARATAFGPEGSEDGTTWLEYEFKYKAGNGHRRPPWVAPRQPRLDWQMWFAALSRFNDEPWFQNLLVRLLEADSEVLKLLERDPFQGRKPRYIRAVLYRYRFADAGAREAEGAWWTRERLGEYSPTLSLRAK